MTDYDLYILAEIKYKKKYPDIDESILLPLDWYKSNNYKLKVEIIAEALKNNIRIENTKLYQDKYIEGVRP